MKRIIALACVISLTNCTNAKTELKQELRNSELLQESLSDHWNSTFALLKLSHDSSKIRLLNERMDSIMKAMDEERKLSDSLLTKLTEEK